MSNTGNRNLAQPDKEVLKKLSGKPASSKMEDRIDFQMKKWRLLGSPGYPSSDEYLRKLVIAMLDRGITAQGTIRQYLAIAFAHNREPDLAKLNTPTLVIHGDKDCLIKVDGGIATAKIIPNSKLEIISGMGHDFPESLNQRIAMMIIEHVSSKHMKDSNG